MAMNMQSSDPTAAGAAQMAQPGAGAPGAGGQGAGPQQIVIQAVGDGTYTLTVDGQPGQQPMQPQDLCDALEEVLGVAAEPGEGAENEGSEPNAQAMWDQEADKAQKTRAMQDSY
jgi:hypothetical protein